MSRIQGFVLCAIMSVVCCIVAGCDECSNSSDCGPAQVCMDGQCKTGSSNPFPESSTDISGGDVDGDVETDTETESDSESNSETEVDAGTDTSTETTEGGGNFTKIKGGSFTMWDLEVTVPTFYLMSGKVTVKEYTNCVEKGGACAFGSGEGCNNSIADESTLDVLPINCVNYNDAQAYCSWAGARLPSHAEWKYAAEKHGDTLDGFGVEPREWVEDTCDNSGEPPTDGSAWVENGATTMVTCMETSVDVFQCATEVIRDPYHGFRCAKN